MCVCPSTCCPAKIPYQTCDCVLRSARGCWRSTRRWWRTGTSITRTRGWRTSSARATSSSHQNKVGDRGESSAGWLNSSCHSARIVFRLPQEHVCVSKPVFLLHKTNLLKPPPHVVFPSCSQNASKRCGKETWGPKEGLRRLRAMALKRKSGRRTTLRSCEEQQPPRRETLKTTQNLSLTF